MIQLLFKLLFELLDNNRKLSLQKWEVKDNTVFIIVERNLSVGKIQSFSNINLESENVVGEITQMISDIKSVLLNKDERDLKCSTGIELIMKERFRQINDEGFSLEYDDEFQENGELSSAAACYAISEKKRGDYFIDSIWPYSILYWKPTPENRVRELEKAGALCAAEIDRLLRKEATQCQK